MGVSLAFNFRFLACLIGNGAAGRDLTLASLKNRCKLRVVWRKSSRIEIAECVNRQRPAVNDPAVGVGDQVQLHLAAALLAANRWFGGYFERLLLLQEPAPTKIEPDQHLNPLELQLAVGRSPTVVTKSLKLRWQRVLQKATNEFDAGD